eukprot:6053975-Ditylum_brightwellii.AAC.1
MENSYTVPPDGTEARQLYKSGQGLIYIRKHELTLDDREAFCEMMDFYERKENLTLIQTNCNTNLSKMRLDQNYKGGPLTFFLAFQNVYLVLENCAGKTVPDEEKIGTLNTSMDDSCFSSVCTTIETLTLQTKILIDYASYLQSLIMFAENLKPNTSITHESNKLQKAGGWDRRWRYRQWER